MSQSGAGDSSRGSTEQARQSGEHELSDNIDASENAFQKAIAVWRGSYIQARLMNDD